jgi:16S rRNA (guanine527-N7)-methyltransferase
MDRGRPDELRFGARRVDAGSGAAPRGTHGQGGVPIERRREPLPTRVQDTPPLPSAYDEALERGLGMLRLEPTAAARTIIDGHVRLLLAWTSAINLTAIRAPGSVAVMHVVDSLTAHTLIAAIRPRRLLDLGSGGGFPGIPLAATLIDGEPAPEVTLLEPIGKKARFLSAVVDATGLAGRVTVDGRRAEDLARAQIGGWDIVTARAVAPTAELVELAFPLLAPGGALVAWKRGDLKVELTAARRAIDALGGGGSEVVGVGIDGLDDHCLVVATRAQASRVPDGFPRDPGQRKRRPW